MYLQLDAEYNLHRKSRTTKHQLYPVRFCVPDDKVDWKVDFPEYAPEEYNAPVVLNTETEWADPQDIKQVAHAFKSFHGKVRFNSKGFPLNPIGRTGICGRGVLGKWGANFAVDALITTTNQSTNELLALTIQRKDTGEMAFPGGMVDEGESAVEARNRELMEELSLEPSQLGNAEYGKVVIQGYVDDPRNTDNAWIETTAFHIHQKYDTAQQLDLKAGDDAAAFEWHRVGAESFRNFYASHGLTLWKAICLIPDRETIPGIKNFVGQQEKESKT